MLLAIDIGNTNINIGIFNKNRLYRRLQFRLSASSRHYKNILSRHIKKAPEGVIICSVVPQQTKIIKAVLLSLFTGIKIYTVGKDIRVPIKNLYRNPRQVGQDRLVGAYAASRFYGPAVVIIDFGTAVTIDLVSKSAYLGGIIAPGMEMSLTALNKMTALLPKAALSKPRSLRSLIGRETKESILSGVIFGFSAMAEGLIKKIKRKFGSGLKVVGTGGGIGLILPYVSGIDTVDKDLVLKGLLLLYPSKGDFS